MGVGIPYQHVAVFIEAMFNYTSNGALTGLDAERGTLFAIRYSCYMFAYKLLY